MSTMKREELWQRLLTSGLVEGDLPTEGDASAPWFVRVMLGIAGWIGAMFLLGFVGAGFAFVFKSTEAAFVVGILVCAAAAFIFRAVPKNDFVAQFGLAVSLAGQFLMVFGASKWFDRSAGSIALYISVQQALLFFAVPNYVHRVWAAWTCALAVASAMLDAELFVLTPAVVTGAFAALALAEFKFARHGEMVRAGIYGLALAAVLTSVLHGQLLAEFVTGHWRQELLGGSTLLWVGRLASLAVLLGSVIALLRREKLAVSSGPGRIAVMSALILGLVSIKAPGVGPATVILIAGFANANRVLAGLGIFALLGYLSHYYYSLETTLLEKSGLLIVFGVALLLARLAMRFWWPATENKDVEAPHA
jgi:hypothetical protein